MTPLFQPKTSWYFMSQEQKKPNGKNRKKRQIAMAITVLAGAALGLTYGIVTSQIGMATAIGVAVGVAIGVSRETAKQ